MTALMPNSGLKLTISDMKIGDTGWVVPWAMEVDKDRYCWLKPSFIVSNDPADTGMRIQRQSNGFHIWPPKDVKWNATGEAINATISVEYLHWDDAPPPGSVTADALRTTLERWDHRDEILTWESAAAKLMQHYDIRERG